MPFFFFERPIVPRFRVCKESGKDGAGGALLKYVLEKSCYAPKAFCDLINCQGALSLSPASATDENKSTKT